MPIDTTEENRDSDESLEYHDYHDHNEEHHYYDEDYPEAPDDEHHNHGEEHLSTAGEGDELEDQEHEIRELKDQMGELVSMIRTMKATRNAELRERAREIANLRAGSVARSEVSAREDPEPPTREAEDRDAVGVFAAERSAIDRAANASLADADEASWFSRAALYLALYAAVGSS